MKAIQRHAWAVACVAILFVSQTARKAQAFQISQTTRKLQWSTTESRTSHQIPASFTILQLLPEENENEPQPTQSFKTWTSLQALAVAVSLFFAGTVFLLGDQLLPSPTASSIEPRQILNADTILREDFTRYEDASSR
jgi:hypothetical protein